MVGGTAVVAARTAAGLLGVLAVAASALPALAGANLMIEPKRLVFEGRTRSGELTLVNLGDEPGTYRLWFKDVLMRPDGSFEEVPAEAAINPARDLVRYAPRQVTLAPGESQTVRVALRKPKDLAPGEYRSHLVLTALPPPAVPPAADAPSGGFVFDIRANLALSIPVIVREGEVRGEASLAAARLERGVAGEPHLAFEVRRSGNGSLYGDLEVVDEADGAVLAVQRGIAVYTNLDARQVRLPLSRPPSGPLLVRFREPTRHGGQVLAELRVPVGG